MHYHFGGLTPGPKFSKIGDDLLLTQAYHPVKFHSHASTHTGDIHYKKCRQRNKETSTPVIRTGVYPHMPIAVTASGGQFVTQA